MLGTRGAVLRAGGRQLARLLSGQRRAESSPDPWCGPMVATRGTCSDVPSQAPHAPLSSQAPATPATMPPHLAAYPTLDKLGLLVGGAVRIKEPARVEALISGIVGGGFSRLQLVVDFDYTLTRVHMGGHRCHCSWGIMDNSPKMPEYYREEANRLLAKYYPIEVDPKMSEAEKIPHMLEWYEQIHDLLVKCAISRDAIKGMVSASSSRLREGSEELCHTLHGAGVPVLVLSAGMGDVLEEVLRQFNVYTDNVKVVSNFFDYNEEGRMVGFKGKLIHVFNKNEDAIHSSDYFEKLHDRNNVILMGDSLGDIKMAMGVPQPSSVLKIGFLNDKIDERLEVFMDNFDIVLLDDQTMDVTNSIVGLMK
ncbi:7-methylguanosine phosphate-specific 5'-nucleotidase [Chionoecetes opilio]|uniref:5'-nucleotidase n=1 Tax=Chionoecetes opilio TaxID=41210 RepID=A0A8J5CIF1_CHIOP|nr:7-methylguanosine phosphate-specific 5'-nucleotidase [Chionoecetes opilio]